MIYHRVVIGRSLQTKLRRARTELSISEAVIELLVRQAMPAQFAVIAWLFLTLVANRSSEEKCLATCRSSSTRPLVRMALASRSVATTALMSCDEHFHHISPHCAITTS